MDNTTKPIIAAPTAREDRPLDGRKNILTDTLYELGYNDTLVDPLVNILIERNVIDFSVVDDTRDVMDQLSEHYGESALWGDLAGTVALEGLTISLTDELGKDWRTAKGSTFRERIRHIITEAAKALDLKVISCYELENSSTLSEELEDVKRHLTINYGEFNSYLPNVDFAIYTPENSRVIAVISCLVNLKDRIIEQAYWKRKLQTEENKASIKFYLITADLDEALKIVDVPKRERIIAEVELDGTYVLTAEELEESDKVKLFEHFIQDLKKLIEEN
ncbi:MAG: BsaWI family type II restriction enzyme [Candidatus Poribacteria bacterium]|nr:BsaWI family type II restriction enzyme [Candidatus Poribacteria bacterium]MDE0470005.1 BsaWI family type II restriction enzyme [Candidatus Poribacteria bacterium]